jgi:hypothetical protein
VAFPPSLAAGVHIVRLTFALGTARTIRQKFVVAAEATCRGKTFYVPLLPARRAMASVPAVSIPLAASPAAIAAPRVKQAAKVRLTLPCGA